MVQNLLPVSRLSSPTLRGFEINPFRVLRLGVNATTSEASFQAERVLTLVRAGLPPEEPDLLPWLPQAGIYELQQAAQTVEEPLLRLTEQLLWFDLGRDMTSGAVQSMIGNLKVHDLRTHFEQETWLPEVGKCDPLNAEGVPLVAQAINQANLRLLIAASLLSGAVIPQKPAPVEPRKIARGEWKRIHGFKALPEAHRVMTDNVPGPDSNLQGQHYWEGALKRWAVILSHPWFKLYVSECIADLEDDFTSTDDVETIEESIRTRLADLSAKETRFLLLEGRYSLAGEMISAVSRSGFEKRVLGPSLRPIHHLFQSEISELQSLLDETDGDGVEHIDAYLKRLEVIKTRWLTIDKSGIVGLSHILDEAIEQAYLQLRRRPQLPVESEALLEKAANLAVANSLREKVDTFRRELEEARNRICHFCKTEVPDYEKSVVLEGHRETSREQHYNSTTVYYAIRYGIVLRCARCAQFHDFIRKVGLWTMLFLLPGLIYLAFPLFALSFLVIFVVAVYGGWRLAPFVFKGVLAMFRYAVAVALTPRGHTRCGKYEDTEAFDSLSSEGYSVQVHWKSNAVSSLEKKNK